jgi:hypothetical protein
MDKLLKIIKTNRIVFILVTTLPFYTNAQISITGIVKDQDNRLIKYANVVLTDSDGFIVVGNITDDDGKFELSYDEKCDCKLSITYLGYEDWSQSIQTDKNIELGIIKLVEKASELEEVSITSRRKVITRVGKKLVFNVENSEEVSGLDGLETLKFAPRVDPTSDCPSVFGKDYTLIYINGRPSNQPNASICKYLATLQSDEIKKIEVITTTSAKLDAEGNKAIINIVLKEKTNIGFDGSTSIQYNQRTFPTYWPSTSLTYSSKKLSTSLNASFFNEKQKNDISSDILFNESSRQIETVRKPHIKGFIGSLNLNYKVTQKIDIGTRFSSTLNKSEEEARSETFYNNIVNQAIDSTSTLPTRGNLDYEYYGLSLYGDFKLDTLGSKLKISANTLRRIQGDNKALQSTIFLGNTTNIIRSEAALNNSDVDYSVNSIIADVEISKPKTKWEFGGKVTLINNDSDISFFNTSSGTPILDPNQSNNFLYDETILATYLSFDSYHWEKWFIQLGLRFENTKTKGESITLNEINNNNYNNVFPSAYVSYDPNKNHSFSLGYSTSIDRPKFYSVNPFRTYNNFFSFSEGNPQLLPSYTHNLEFSYILKNNLSFFVSNNFINDSFDYLTLTSESNNLEVTSPQNYFDQYVLDIDIRYNWKPKKWYSNRFSLNWSYSESTSDIPNITLAKLTGSGLTLSSSSIFIVNQKKENKLYLRFFQNLPSTDGFVNTENSANLTLGGVFQFLNKNLILQLQARDVFRQQRIIAIENYQNYRYETKIYNDAQAFVCMLTYKFGNKKSRKRQRNVDQSEQNRMN